MGAEHEDDVWNKVGKAGGLIEWGIEPAFHGIENVLEAKHMTGAASLAKQGAGGFGAAAGIIGAGEAIHGGSEAVTAKTLEEAGEGGYEAVQGALSVLGAVPGMGGPAKAGKAAAMATHFGDEEAKRMELLRDQETGRSESWSDWLANRAQKSDEAAGGGMLGTIAAAAQTIGAAPAAGLGAIASAAAGGVERASNWLVGEPGSKPAEGPRMPSEFHGEISPYAEAALAGEVKSEPKGTIQKTADVVGDVLTYANPLAMGAKSIAGLAKGIGSLFEKKKEE
jgi:hypothetical protein